MQTMKDEGRTRRLPRHTTNALLRTLQRGRSGSSRHSSRRSRGCNSSSLQPPL